MSVGYDVRQFFRELLGSRLVERLEEDLLRVRGDYETRLHEREEVIAEQRSRIAELSGKLERYELVLLPLTSPVGDLFKTKREPLNPQLFKSEQSSSWQQKLADWDRDQEELLKQEKLDEISRRKSAGQQVPDVAAS